MMKKILITIILIAMIPLVWGMDKTTECSWYGDKYKGKAMASRVKFDPAKPYIASWDYPFGTWLQLEYGTNKVMGVVMDRGPARRLYHKGRKLDISKSLFKKLVGDLDVGVVKVKYRKVTVR